MPNPDRAGRPRSNGRPRRARPSLPRFGLAVLPLLFLSMEATCVGQSSPLRVEWQDARLSVVAQNVPLLQILTEVGKQTGLQVQNPQGLTATVSAHFSDLTLAAGVQSLLAGVDYAVFGDLASPKSASASRVVILNNLEASDAAGVGARVKPPVPVAANNGMVSTDKQAWIRLIMGPDLAKQTEAFENLMNIDPQKAIETLEQAARNGQGEGRLQALQLLDQDSEAGDDTVLASLRAALQDEDVAMRDYAVQAIARRGGPETMDLLTQAYRDADPQVRLMVIQNAAQQKAGGLDLLREAVSDPDPNVSGAASALLQALTPSEPDR
ncbi:MAG TPA: HEAT repeat domain-containing protein [Terriglobia bacterium]|nr:HEAT repeat domain-containing protein [Terriglobia bacterium]